MRYDGQGYDVTVPLAAHLPAEGDFARLRDAFHAAHRSTYGHANEAAAIWLKELRAHMTAATAKPRIVPIEPAGGGTAAAKRDFRLSGRAFAAAIYERADLHPGQPIVGPAIINQMDATSLIPEGWQARTSPRALSF
jgi:N-methylhydantoinase A